MFNIFRREGTIDETKLDVTNIRIETYLPVYITMSTIPSRLKTTLKIIKNFLAHVQGIEKLILNVPYKYNRWPNFNTSTIKHDIDDPRFVLYRTKDYGPVTKLLPVLEDNLIPQNSILIVCDDMCYKLSAFKDIAELQDKRVSESFSYYVYPYSDNPHNKSVNVPQGADLISMYVGNVRSFPRWFHDIKTKLNVESYFDTPCFFVDDQVIGWYFQYMKIPMLQVERKHRNIYIKDCDKGKVSDNLNAQTGKNSRDNTMRGCYRDLSSIYPLH